MAQKERLVECFRGLDPGRSGVVPRPVFEGVVQAVCGDCAAWLVESVIAAAGVDEREVRYEAFADWVYGESDGPAAAASLRGRAWTAPLLLSPGVDEGAQKYVGSYAMLRDFLKECRDVLKVLDATRHRQLLGAVEDLYGRGPNRVNAGQGFFKGHEQDIAAVLPGLGISFQEDGACSNCGIMFMPDAKFCRNCGRPRSHDSELDALVASPRQRAGEPDVPHDSVLLGGSPSNAQRTTSSFKDVSDLGILRLIEFDKRSRGDIDLDVDLMSFAFKVPFGLLDRFNIEESVLRAWTDATARQYIANPYHDWTHAVDTVQFVHMALTEGRVCKHLSHHDILALLLACVGHDVGHMGTNNAFLLKTAHALALTYNDKSPLENMHASRVFQTFKMPGKNVLETMKSDAAAKLRQKIIDAILATDMTHHMDLVENLAENVEDLKNDETTWHVDTNMLMQCCIHMADLGHTCRPWRVHKYLVVALEDEFFKQGDQERDMGLPITPLMDRTKDSTPSGQGFFLDKLVRPLLDPFCFFFEETVADTLQSNLRANRENWARLVEQHGKVTARQMILERGDDDDGEAAGPRR